MSRRLQEPNAPSAKAPIVVTNALQFKKDLACQTKSFSVDRY